MSKVNFEKKNYTFCHWNISVSYTTREYDNVTTPYYPFFALLSVKWSLTGGWKQKKISKKICVHRVQSHLKVLKIYLKHFELHVPYIMRKHSEVGVHWQVHNKTPSEELTCTTYPVIHLKLLGCLSPLTRTWPDKCLRSFRPANISRSL